MRYSEGATCWLERLGSAGLISASEWAVNRSLIDQLGFEMSSDSSGNSTPTPVETGGTDAANNNTATSLPKLNMVAERLRELKEKRESARKENLAEVILVCPIRI